MDNASEKRLAAVHSTLQSLVRRMASTLAREGITITVVQGLRTYAEQDALYAQGRTALGKIVTNARGGHSWHNFGLAVDCAPLHADGTIDWSGTSLAWQEMIECGVALGLTSGARWKSIPDRPHFQLTGQWPEAAPPDEVRVFYAGGGLPAVWHELKLPDSLNVAPIVAAGDQQQAHADDPSDHPHMGVVPPVAPEERAGQLQDGEQAGSQGQKHPL